MGRIIIRRAEPDDAEGIARVCAEGWRDTYAGIYTPEQIESVIAEYYTPERIAAEIEAAAPASRLLGTLTTDQATQRRLQSLLDRFCVRLDLPSLRDRRDDIEALVRDFVGRHATGRALRFHPAAVAALQAHIEQRREDLAETGRDGAQASTDALLAAFQRYRELFEGVLSTYSS